MRVKMLTLDAGPAGVRQPGTVVDVDKAEGDALVKGGYAELVVAPKKGRAKAEGGDPAEGEELASDDSTAGAGDGTPQGDAA